MSKKHYIMLAKVIRNSLHSINNSSAYFAFMDLLCNSLREDNPKFDTEKFRYAAQGNNDAYV